MAALRQGDTLSWTRAPRDSATSRRSTVLRLYASRGATRAYQSDSSSKHPHSSAVPSLHHPGKDPP